LRLYPFFLPHAGCPHRCLFCRQESTGEGGAPSPAEVAGQLDRLLPPSGDGEVAFYGGTFTLLPRRQQAAYLEAVAPFVRSGRVEGVRISTRPDAVSEGCAEWLAGQGVSTVELGCQSFSPTVLRLSGRGHGPLAAADAALRLRQAGLGLGLQLMPGLPGGDRREAIESLAAALALRPDFIRIYPTVVLLGTALAQLYVSGTYRPFGLEQAVACCAEMLWRCEKAEIPVIRMGLQATPELDSAQLLVAGPYHPAFGQLVRSRLWLRALIRGRQLTGAFRAAVHPSDMSDALGHRRSNLLEMLRRFDFFSLESQPALPRGMLSLGGELFSRRTLCAYEG